MRSGSSNSSTFPNLGRLIDHEGTVSRSTADDVCGDHRDLRPVHVRPDRRPKALSPCPGALRSRRSSPKPLAPGPFSKVYWEVDAPPESEQDPDGARPVREGLPS